MKKIALLLILVLIPVLLISQSEGLASAKDNSILHQSLSDSITIGSIIIYSGYSDPVNMVSQETTNEGFRKNSVYLELLGAGFVYSLNYERILSIDYNYALVIRGGLSIISAVPSFVGGATIIMGGPKHLIEFGAGIFLFPGDPIAYSGSLGYRYMGPEGLLVRVAPMLIKESILFGPFWMGFSLGYSF